MVDNETQLRKKFTEAQMMSDWNPGRTSGSDHHTGHWIELFGAKKVEVLNVF